MIWHQITYDKMCCIPKDRTNYETIISICLNPEQTIVNVHFSTEVLSYTMPYPNQFVTAHHFLCLKDYLPINMINALSTAYNIVMIEIRRMTPS